MRFTTPSAEADIDNLMLPYSYITYNVTSIDGNDHSVQIYYESTAEMAGVNLAVEFVLRH